MKKIDSSRPLRVGSVGAGAIVRMAHLPAISSLPGIELVAVVDPDIDRARTLAADYGANAYQDHRDMLAAEDLDVILVAIPNNMHRTVIEDVAAAGVHVLCEKPLAHTLVDAIAIQEACHKARVLLQVGFNQRFWAPVRVAKHAIDSGTVGEVHGLRSVYSEAYNVYPASTKYRYDLAQSGGACILDLTVHRIDLVRYFMGDIVEVCATVDHRVIPFPSDDNVFLLVRFASGATGVISSDRFSPQVASVTDLFGSQGTIHISTETQNPHESVPLSVSSQLPVEQLPEEFLQSRWPSAWWIDYEPGTWIPIIPPRENPYELEWGAFEHSIRSGEEPIPSGIDGVKAQEVVTAAYRSVRQHGWVSLPLGDPEEPIPTYEMNDAGGVS